MPFVYGLKMRDGKGVVVRVPRLCEGLRSGIGGIGSISEDLLPFLAVYEDADKPTSGWLYATDDAYKSPLAELTLPKSEITAATAADFRKWRAEEAGKNIIRPEMFEGTGKRFGPIRSGQKWQPGQWMFG